MGVRVTVVVEVLEDDVGGALVREAARQVGPLHGVAQLEHVARGVGRVAGQEARESRRKEGAVGEGLYVHGHGALVRPILRPFA